MVRWPICSYPTLFMNHRNFLFRIFLPRALSLQQLGRHADAASDFDAAIAEGPVSWQRLWHRAICLAELGETFRASAARDVQACVSMAKKDGPQPEVRALNSTVCLLRCCRGIHTIRPLQRTTLLQERSAGFNGTRRAKCSFSSTDALGATIGCHLTAVFVGVSPQSQQRPAPPLVLSVSRFFPPIGQSGALDAEFLVSGRACLLPAWRELDRPRMLRSRQKGGAAAAVAARLKH